MNVQVLSRSGADNMLLLLQALQAAPTTAADVPASVALLAGEDQEAAMAAFLLIDAAQLDALLTLLGDDHAALLGRAAQPDLVNLTYQPAMARQRMPTLAGVPVPVPTPGTEAPPTGNAAFLSGAPAAMAPVAIAPAAMARARYEWASAPGAPAPDTAAAATSDGP